MFRRLNTPVTSDEGFRPSGVLDEVGWFVIDVSGQRVGHLFNDQDV